MLSRTAEYLYWISRYMERAETNARLLDVGYRMSLFPNPNGYNNEWESVLAAAGAIQGYKNKYNIIEQKKVEDYLFFDEDNPSSVFNCILNARSNALVVRTSFTPESWLAINKTYQEILKLKNNNFNASDLPNLTEWTIEQVNLFRGSLSSLLRNDGYNFLYLGLFVERADNSARLLDVKYFVLLPKPQYIGGNIDNMQWSILLRSLSSFRAFRWAYDGDVTSTKIADFLVLNSDCPRSLSFCIQNIVKHLTNLTCSPEKVTKIAFQIYDQTKNIFHSDNDPKAKELLWAASNLYNCGKYVNVGSYHKHSWYLIKHCELLGYSEAETNIIASIARYHRKTLPKKRHESWQNLISKEDKTLVLEMSLILRLTKGNVIKTNLEGTNVKISSIFALKKPKYLK